MNRCYPLKSRWCGDVVSVDVAEGVAGWREEEKGNEVKKERGGGRRTGVVPEGCLE